jgi:hypothetical protein
VSDAFGIGIKPFFSGVLVVGHWRKHTLAFTLFYQVYFAAPLSPLFLTLPAAPVLPCCTGNAKHRMLSFGKSRLIAASHPKGIHPTRLHMHTIHLHMHSPHTAVRCTRQMVLNTEMRFVRTLPMPLFISISDPIEGFATTDVTSFSVLVRSPLVNGLFLTSLRPQMCQFSFPICFPQTLPELRLLAAY